MTITPTMQSEAVSMIVSFIKQGIPRPEFYLESDPDIYVDFDGCMATFSFEGGEKIVDLSSEIIAALNNTERLIDDEQQWIRERNNR